MAKMEENTKETAKKEVKTEKKAEKRYGFVVNGSLNIRKEPKPTAQIVGTFKNGEKIELLGEKSGYYKVTEGYVLADFIDIA